LQEQELLLVTGPGAVSAVSAYIMSAEHQLFGFVQHARSNCLLAMRTTSAADDDHDDAAAAGARQ
jgi:hypothetical protein